MTIVCRIYRSRRREGMYLFVDERDDLAKVPPELLRSFGPPELAMTLELAPERRLALADTAQVLQALAAQGFYLQMPPRPDLQMQSIHQHNSKIGR